MTTQAQPQSQAPRWIDPNAPDQIIALLRRLGVCSDHEHLQSVRKAGEGNMNLTLRVITDRQRLILKQARPWVEKYPHIPAPIDRLTQEHRFYDLVSRIEPRHAVAERMPKVLAFSPADHVLLLEDLTHTLDLISIYQGEVLDTPDIESLSAYLAHLHLATRGHVGEAMANRAMRQLNHEHIYRLPLTPDNGLELDQFEPGLGQAAATLMRDRAYVSQVHAIGDRYLADGPCLVHGDFFPGSWLKSVTDVWVIDPEFSYVGDPEFDLGCAAAHFVLARRPQWVSPLLTAYRRTHDIEDQRLASYAGAEVMRRLIGVAQLPLPVTHQWRSQLLNASRDTLINHNLEALCDPALALLD